MDLTDGELDAVYICIYHEVYYGDDDVVYSDSEYSVSLRAALRKVEDEIKARKL